MGEFLQLSWQPARGLAAAESALPKSGGDTEHLDGAMAGRFNTD
jgi:hypothetical protein